MTCYKGGETVFNNHQMCDVTSTFSFPQPLAFLNPIPDRKIIDMLPDRPPQVTFSCNSLDRTCAFQFWTAQVESFYCALDECSSGTQRGYKSNTTTYNCEKIKCKCVPGRFICGEDGSIGRYSYRRKYGACNHGIFACFRYLGFLEGRNQRTRLFQLQDWERVSIRGAGNE